MGSGDGWITCAAGHRHWGRFGAAGLLVFEADRVLLQHRAPWTHNGDTFGILGGARDRQEAPVQAALREASEEAGLNAEDIDPLGIYVDDHGGWTYSTIVAAPVRPLRPTVANAESVAVGWHPVTEVERLPLHAGFAASWPRLRHRPPRLTLMLAAELEATASFQRLLSDGVPVHAIDRRELGVHRLYPHRPGSPAAGTAELTVSVPSLAALLRLAG